MEQDYTCGCGGRGLCARGANTGHYCQLNTYDYMADIPGNDEWTDLVEVQFKNTRKGYYHNINGLPLTKGDIVAVEASPGHDIGTVTLTGKLVPLQLKKANLKSSDEVRRIYRKARPVDMEKYEEAKAREHETMIQSRQIAKDLGLEMKIGDVEYQGDGNKAIFYYIADGRVDFRQLIKVLAEAFHVRIEMRQIGARQEAGRIGGFGPCGRELCCATWMKNFVSVGTGAARFQGLSLNPQKLAGQCAKLKCCINYEVDQYMEASSLLPSREIVLQSLEGDYYLFKTDILSGMVTYSTDKRIAANHHRRASQGNHRHEQGRREARHHRGRRTSSTRPAHRPGHTGRPQSFRQEEKEEKEEEQTSCRNSPSRGESATGFTAAAILRRMGCMRRLVVLLPLLCMACTRHTLIHSFRAIPEEGWRRSDTLVFTLPPSPDDAEYALYIDLRLHNRFPYRELWLAVEHHLPDSSLISRDTLCYHLSDESGNLCGQGINLLQYETRAGTLPLRTGEETQIRIHHLMRRETLPYIMEVGVRVTP